MRLLDNPTVLEAFFDELDKLGANAAAIESVIRTGEEVAPKLEEAKVKDNVTATTPKTPAVKAETSIGPEVKDQTPKPK